MPEQNALKVIITVEIDLRHIPLKAFRLNLPQ